MEQLFSGIYKNRKVLITGHTGFKGSWLCMWLAQMEAIQLGYALEPNTDPNHFSMLSIPMESIIGDIRDAKKLSKIFQEFQAEIVFASKGCSELVTSSYRNSFFNLDEYGRKHNTLIASARAGQCPCR